MGDGEESGGGGLYRPEPSLLSSILENLSVVLEGRNTCINIYYKV